ncbi:MAG: hypothetical protein KIC80_06340 [Brachyspira sp.]|nr:hypothetical protein [Brachyspira sp.]CCY23583.1 unknown [Brachyspira sp. CAG:484]
MKFLQIRKYLFLNMAAALSVLFWRSIYIYFTIDFPLELDDPIITNRFPHFVNIFLWAFVVLLSYGFAIIEILIRTFVINKYFHFKFNFPIKLPKFLDILYSVLFFTGLLLSIGPALFAVLFILEANFLI